VPLLALLVGSQFTVPSGGSAPVQRLTRAQDVVGAVASLVVTVLLEGVLLLAPLLVAVGRPAPGYSRREGLRALGFRGIGLFPLLGWLLAGLTFGIAANAAYSLLIQALRLPLQTNGDQLAKLAQYAPLTTLATLAGAVLIAPICEEVFFRGFLEAGLLRGVNGTVAIILSALLFGIAHGDLGSFALIAILGLVLGVARFSSGSLWPGLIIHTANNALAAVILLPIILPVLAPSVPH
jgi:membrane protease YdiL (CAAX protease family)